MNARKEIFQSSKKGSERHDAHPVKVRGICRAIFMIGDTLRKEREKQKLTLQDVEQGTSIRTVYIDALEKGEYDKLPGEVYAKGFIKNYGNFLELDGESLVRQFIQEISLTAVESENSQVENSNSENKIAAKNISQKYPVKENDISSENETSNSKKYLVAAVALITFLIGGIFYSFSGSNEEAGEIAQNTNSEIIEIAKVDSIDPVSETTPTELNSAVSQAPATEPVAADPAPASGVNLQAAFTDDCWTRVIADGKMIFEGMINAGQTFDWKGEKSVSVLLGNAGAVNFTMNGENIGSLGKDGAVVRRTFTTAN